MRIKSGSTYREGYRDGVSCAQWLQLVSGFVCPPAGGSQSFPSPAADPSADGATTVYFSPTQPQASPRGNWIQTKGWFTILRLYSPLEPFFTKKWPVARARSNS